jgi:hypothetical protein
MREAMAGRLPADLLERHKTPLAADPVQRALRDRALPPLERRTELEAWIDIGRLPIAPRPAELRSTLAVHALDYWLGRSQTGRIHGSVDRLQKVQPPGLV